MLKVAAAYAVTLVVMVALDLLWLGVVAKNVYQEGIGHLMAEQPNIPAAVLFYVVFAIGLTIFAVQPQDATASWHKTALYAAGFGFFAYATYDLTNLATLKNWPIGLALLDMGWGAVVSGVSATAGKLALDRLAAG